MSIKIIERYGTAFHDLFCYKVTHDPINESLQRSIEVLYFLSLLLRLDVASIGLSLEEKRLLKEVNIGDVDTERDWANIGYLNWENRPYKLLPFRPFKISK